MVSETRVRVPAIVFDYPRHSGATDEGMPNRPSIFASLVFGPGGITIERNCKAHKGSGWMRPGNYTWRASKDSRSPNWISLRLGLIQNRSDLYFS
jgi:hypothetical protein